MELFDKTTYSCSKLFTEQYSTSFTLGIKTLDKKLQLPIYSIYGFVRIADEIVDTFHDFDKKTLLNQIKNDVFQAINDKISLNPILHAFQLTVNQYKIEHELIESFLNSMEMDLSNQKYDSETYKSYIFGSAEVVGLMCLRVFCEGNSAQYDALKADAQSLGAAFQKVNFLRDIKSDFVERGRFYFPAINFNNFTDVSKKAIEEDIQKDFDLALRGIKNLPKSARQGVYLAYIYYLALFNKIKNLPANQIQQERIRVNDGKKLALLAKTYLQKSLNFI